MKKNYFWKLTALGMLFTSSVLAQKDNVGIGTTKPEPSAVLDVNSTSKGLLIPRMTLQQRDAIQNPANGLMVYQSDLLSGFYFFDGKEWKPLTSATTAQNSVAGTDGDWTLLGNSGTNASTNFIGTTDNQPLMFRVNNQSYGGFDIPSSGNVGIGLSALNASLSNQQGTSNLAFGNSALALNTGSVNTAVGTQALYNNLTGGHNIGIGYQSGFINQSGSRNMSIGGYSLYENTGNDNVGIGYEAVKNTTGWYNVGIGSNAGVGRSGNNNLYLGYNAGARSGATITEDNKLYIHSSISSNAVPLIGGDFSKLILRFHVGTPAPTNTTGYLAIGDFSAATPAVLNFGNGSIANTSFRLVVQDGILTEKLKVALKGTAEWADYVFEPEYKLMPLESVEQFTKLNNHLPNVPSADEIVKSGLDVAQTSKMLMEKIEELTLYMIEMNKEIKALKAENAKLKK